MLRRLRDSLAARLRRAARISRAAAEPSRLIVGSTGSGKSEAELRELIHLAGRGGCAVVLLDGHGPLALRAAGHWAMRGHEDRIVYEPLTSTDRVLAWDMLSRSPHADRSRRRIADAETAAEVAQAFLARRGLATLDDKPWTQEWLLAAIRLCLAQPRAQPLDALLSAFRVGLPDYERLLDGCEDPDVAAKFREGERLRRRSPSQWELQTGPARRLLEPICTSEVVRLRCRPGPFDWLCALREQRLIAFDGGGLRANEVKRSLFLLASLQVINAVRRHFAETQRPLPVVLVLEEAGALGLVTPFVLQALAELRKAGLALHLICQSGLDFGGRDEFHAVLANVPVQAWHQCLSPADQEVGAKALTNASFDAMAVHFTRSRSLPDGSDAVPSRSHGRSIDLATGSVRFDRRTAITLRPRHRLLSEDHYAPPQLQEQRWRTALATLRVGQRIVRDRHGVRRERQRPVRPPFGKRLTGEGTRELIERVRRQPIYLPCPAEPSPATAARLPSAAEVLRAEAAGKRADNQE